MKGLRLPGRFGSHSVCHVVAPYLGLISSFRSLDRGNRCPNARVLLTGLTPLPVFLPKDLSGSPKFPANPSCICPALRLRSDFHARPLRRFGVAPVSKTTKAPTTQYFRSSITRLLHSLFTLRAALTDDDAKLASGGWPTLPHGLSHTHRVRSESFRSALPLSQGFAWRHLLLAQGPSSLPEEGSNRTDRQLNLCKVGGPRGI